MGKINSIEEFEQAERAMIYKLIKQLEREGLFEPEPGNVNSGQFSIGNMPLLGDRLPIRPLSFPPIPKLFSQRPLFQLPSFEDNKPKGKKARVIYSSSTPGYKWEPETFAKESPSMLADWYGFTPEEAHVGGDNTLPVSNNKRSQVVSNVKSKILAKTNKKNARVNMGTTAAKIFTKVNPNENKSAKQDVLIENVRDKWRAQLNGQCFKACEEILNAVKIYPIGGSVNQLQMALETSDHTALNATKDFDKGINYIDEQLDKGNGVRVGVNHTLNYQNGILPNEPPGVPATTDHYIVIYGRKYDAEKKEYYYLYADDGATTREYGISDKNRLYLDEMAKALSGVRPFKSLSGKKITYTVTQVSANEENGA